MVITVPSKSGLGVACSHSVVTVSGMAELWPDLADGIPITAAVRSGGLTPSGPGVAVQLLAFNASVQWAGKQTGHQFLLPRGSVERGGVGPFSRG